MSTATVSELLSGQRALGDTVEVRGWVRTRRTSKAGISFIAVHDGSCFDAIQVVAPDSLKNYESDVTNLGAGCAIVATGELVESEGQGQSLEIQASQIEVIGWVDDPEKYPIAKKRHTFEYLRTQAHLRPRTNAIGGCRSSSYS